jgi:hypothetical protein
MVTCMVAIKDLVEEWIEMRSTLQKQLKALETGELGTHGAIVGSTTETTKVRIRKWIEELNALLKEYASAREG